jgi:hypothetical protein
MNPDLINQMHVDFYIWGFHSCKHLNRYIISKCFITEPVLRMPYACITELIRYSGTPPPQKIN